MKKIFLLKYCLFFLSIFSTPLFSQSLLFKDSKFEVGFGMGPSFFLGDLGGTYGPGKPFIRDINFPLTKLAKGVFFIVYPKEWVGFRLALNHSFLEGDDNLINPKGGEEVFRYNRNLYFQSQVSEVYLATELYPTIFMERYSGLKGKLRPYGIIGVGLFHFNPKAYYYSNPNDPKTKQLVELKPLRLEGQGMAEYPKSKEYSLTQPEIPIGLGFKYYLKENCFIGMEILHRKTFTDYIDDVSTDYVNPVYFQNYLSVAAVPIALQLHNREPLRGLIRPYVGTIRGNPKEMDSYFSFLFRLAWRLNWNNGFGSGALKSIKCPS